MQFRLFLGFIAFQLTAQLHAATGQQVWTIPFTLAAPPAVRTDGSVVAQSADTLLLVSSDGTERWRKAVSAAPSSSAQPPMIDDTGNITVLTSTGVSSYDPNGTLRWSVTITFPSSYTTLALGRNGQTIVKSGDEWYALDASGRTLWSRTWLPGPVMVGAPRYSNSPAIVGPDGNIRVTLDSDQVEIRSSDTGSVLSTDKAYRGLGDFPPFADAKLLGLGPSGESLVLAGWQAPQLNPAVPYLKTPSAGNYRVRWTETSGTGQSWSNAFVLGDPANGPIGNTEPALYGLCSPTGEVLIATKQGTVIMPHQGFGYRRWSETAFAIAENGDVLCCDGAHLVLRHVDQAVAWSAAAEGTCFTLAPSGRVYGGKQTLSAYDTGIVPAAGPWAQPRGDATQRARAPAAFGPFTPHTTSTIDAAPQQQLYDSYAGQVKASPYVQGPGTAIWEKNTIDAAPAADDYSLVVRSAGAADAGTYRLRIDTAQGSIRSSPITVGVVQPTAVRPGVYWGRHRAPNNALYCLEIRPDRTVRYLTSDGQHFTPAMNIRLDPSGAYPWTLQIPQYGAGISLQASGTGVAVSWQNGAAEPATSATASVPSGARTGWYDGNYVGPLDDTCATELALLPNGTLIGTIKGLSGSAITMPIALDANALSQTFPAHADLSGIVDRLTVTFDRSGRVTFEERSFPRYTTVSARFEAFAPDAAPATRLVNLSVRSRAGTSTGTLVAGFVVADPGSFLVRAVGPTLANYGVTAPLATPALELTLPQGTVVGENRGWSKLDAAGMASLVDAATQTGAFQLRPGSADSALISRLGVGLYTALISSADDGDALAEVYAMPPNSGQPAARLVNLSARGRLTAGNPVLTIGFVHVTDAARRILIRGVGPGLKPFVGDATVCANPRLRVYSAAGTVIAANSDWAWYGSGPGASQAPQDGTARDAAAASGAFPLAYQSKDAAVVLNLPGGQYTVQVDSEDGSTGEVLFEVYAVP